MSGSVEQRLDKLEKFDPCKNGHSYRQGEGKREWLIFCDRCGDVKYLPADAMETGFR